MIGSGARLQRVVIDRHNEIPAGIELGGPEEAPGSTTEERKRRLPSSDKLLRQL